LHKDDHSVTCDLFTHRLGGELRCDVDGELFTVHASWNLEELLGASQRWKASFEEMGWAATREASTSTVKKDLAEDPRAV
jgi:hypothetical protein